MRPTTRGCGCRPPPAWVCIRRQRVARWRRRRDRPGAGSWSPPAPARRDRRAAAQTGCGRAGRRLGVATQISNVITQYAGELREGIARRRRDLELPHPSRRRDPADGHRFRDQPGGSPGHLGAVAFRACVSGVLANRRISPSVGADAEFAGVAVRGAPLRPCSMPGSAGSDQPRRPSRCCLRQPTPIPARCRPARLAGRRTGSSVAESRNGAPAPGATTVAGAPARRRPRRPRRRYRASPTRGRRRRSGARSGADGWRPHRDQSAGGDHPGGRCGGGEPRASAGAAAPASRDARPSATNFWTWTPISVSSPTSAPNLGPQASESGAGTLGSPGPRPRVTGARAAGLTMLAGDEFGGGPRMPMVPGTWGRWRDGRWRDGQNGQNGQCARSPTDTVNGGGARQLARQFERQSTREIHQAKSEGRRSL